MRSRLRKTRKAVLLGFAAPFLGAMIAYGNQEQPTTMPTSDQPITVDQIVERTNRVAYYQGADGRAQVSMVIVDSQGRKRNRELAIIRRDQPKPGVEKSKPEDDEKERRKADEFCGEQKFYIYFHRPADVNKMGFLVWKHLDKDDDRWLYLPALDLVKRISSADKRTSFVGSHFFYEDVSGRHIDEDTHELVETSKNYYVLKNTPKDPKNVEFGYFTMWIHRSTFTVVKTEYYDRQGKKYRVYEAKEIKTIQGYPTVTKARMTDLRTKGYTDMEYKEVKYDMGLPETVFSERYLRRPPKQYLK